MKNETKIYRVYGSNMNLKQMSNRCPNAKVIGTGKLKNYKLTFRGISKGVANIEKMQGSTVPIVLWEITAECERALDLYEAYPKLYVKEEVEVITKDGTTKAMVYVMSKQYEQLSAEPSGYYINTIWQGYLENKLPLIKLREAIAENRNETDTGRF